MNELKIGLSSITVFAHKSYVRTSLRAQQPASRKEKE